MPAAQLQSTSTRIETDAEKRRRINRSRNFKSINMNAPTSGGSLQPRCCIPDHFVNRSGTCQGYNAFTLSRLRTGPCDCVF
jgi:hypothetical protein